MCIGIIYDAYTRDYWYRIEKDFNRVKTSMQSIKLPLPIAAIFDSSKNDLVELDKKYRDHRTEILVIAKSIYKDYLLQHVQDPGLLPGRSKTLEKIKESQ
jgi:hypothetical protein